MSLSIQTTASIIRQAATKAAPFIAANSLLCAALVTAARVYGASQQELATVGIGVSYATAIAATASFGWHLIKQMRQAQRRRHSAD